MIKEKTFRNVVVNVVIAALVCGIAVTGLILNNKTINVNDPAPLHRGNSEDKVSLTVNV